MIFKVRTAAHADHLLQRALRWSANLCLAAGVICTSWFVYWWIEGAVYQRYQSHQLDQSMTAGSVTGDAYVPVVPPSSPGKPEDTTDQRPRPGSAQSPIQAGTRQAPADPGLIGRIEIPSVRVSAIVREGVDSKTLSRSVGHVPGTSLPGQNGNVALAAHRERLFRGLRLIREGEEIKLITKTRTFVYAVDSISIVSPADVHVLAPAPEPVITLVTCYPFNYVGRAPKRFIVRGRQITPRVSTMP
jgi:sortase A